MLSPHVQATLTLKHLVAAGKDAERASHIAVRHLRSEELKAFLRDSAEECTRYIAELQTALGQLGTHSVSSGTLGGALHQGLADLSTAATGGSDKDLLTECLRSEEVVTERYEEAVKQTLPSDIHELVNRQLTGIRATCERLRALQSASS